MKKLFFLSFMFFSLCCFSQQVTPTDTTKKSCSCKFNHEVGINSTLLLKQIFNLSNNTFTTLPYDATYKLIFGNMAVRVGAGITMNNSAAQTTTSSTSQNQSPQGPDPQVPTTNNSTNFFYRVGWEYRFALDSKWMAYGGLDFAGQYGTSYSQSSQVFNNLPASYNYTKTTDELTLNAYGGGPVAGIQFFIAKRISIATEIPVYFMYTKQEEITDNYSNVLSSSTGGEYLSSHDSEKVTTSGSKLSVTLPVTLYLSVKF